MGALSWLRSRRAPGAEERVRLGGKPMGRQAARTGEARQLHSERFAGTTTLAYHVGYRRFILRPENRNERKHSSVP